ncbi:hypothetical protein NLX71_24280 [Paenibacillus sp. MZ04-78.2]|uniref:hypothetical protein n=1 Tax=Paenibacillus sp. MZ04-78.2 TaxID=2962034 RepID=UPI0020B77D93|nr:hypothetical protein [Paenibacillus sp. MZ04-78.2]MCP3776378.1 hypothetical protein [Paenibacillus sp. MZ04-78.2]
MIVCTVTSASNLHRAKVMARSIKEHEPQAKVVVCLVEKNVHPLAHFPYFDEVVLAKDLGVPNFPKMIFKYTASEGTTAMKPYLLQYAMRRYADERVFLYLDTDMRVYHPLDELFETLEKHSILITPHALDQRGHNDDYLLAGTYNSGILAFARSEETERFLAWWGDRLYDYCYYDHKYFADQTWLDFAPVYFNAHIWRHPGYNMAAWNLIERNFTHIKNGYHYVNNRPLCLFHYSGLWGHLQKTIKECYPASSNPMYGLLAAYEQELKEMGRSKSKDILWSYDFFSSNEFIEQATKQKYKDDPGKYQGMANPFEASNSHF